MVQGHYGIFHLALYSQLVGVPLNDDCRTTHLTPIRQVCRPFTLVCTKRDRCGAELVAIDGHQVRAVNAKARHCTQAKLTKLLAQIEDRVDASRDVLEAAIRRRIKAQ